MLWGKSMTRAIIWQLVAYGRPFKWLIRGALNVRKQTIFSINLFLVFHLPFQNGSVSFAPLHFSFSFSSSLRSKVFAENSHANIHEIVAVFIYPLPTFPVLPQANPLVSTFSTSEFTSSHSICCLHNVLLLQDTARGERHLSVSFAAAADVSARDTSYPERQALFATLTMLN